MKNRIALAKTFFSFFYGKKSSDTLYNPAVAYKTQTCCVVAGVNTEKIFFHLLVFAAYICAEDTVYKCIAFVSVKLLCKFNCFVYGNFGRNIIHIKKFINSNAQNGCGNA